MNDQSMSLSLSLTGFGVESRVGGRWGKVSK